MGTIARFKYRVKRVVVRVGARILRPFVTEIRYGRGVVLGDSSRLFIAGSAYLNNALVNLGSGTLTVGEYTFAGQDVRLITGVHDHRLTREDRLRAVPTKGHDIVIGCGVWLCSCSVILGPCVIEDDAVIAAGAVVVGGTHVGRGEMWGGVPARFIRTVVV
jgi:acetyltransferase-like isoleucine patch superfamily enzyme